MTLRIENVQTGVPVADEGIGKGNLVKIGKGEGIWPEGLSSPVWVW